MTSRPRILVASAFLAIAVATAVHAQDARPLASIGGPFTGPPVLGAPFSADATTTITQTRHDGTQTTRSGVARYYRDARGRVRVEQDVTDGMGGPQRLIVVDPDPGDRRVYALHPADRVIGLRPRSFIARLFNDGTSLAVPHRFTPEQASRVKELTFAGYRIFRVDARHAVESIESPDLRLLVASRYVEPGVGTFEYRLTNIRREEPEAHLFELPPDYRLLGAGEAPHYIALLYRDR
jgi:hypothetical protein